MATTNEITMDIDDDDVDHLTAKNHELCYLKTNLHLTILSVNFFSKGYMPEKVKNSKQHCTSFDL